MISISSLFIFCAARSYTHYRRRTSSSFPSKPRLHLNYVRKLIGEVVNIQPRRVTNSLNQFQAGRFWGGDKLAYLRFVLKFLQSVRWRWEARVASGGGVAVQRPILAARNELLTGFQRPIGRRFVGPRPRLIGSLAIRVREAGRCFGWFWFRKVFYNVVSTRFCGCDLGRLLGHFFRR